MKLRYNKHFLAVAAGLLAVAASSCKDDVTDSLMTDAYIEADAFYVVSAADKSRVYKAQLNATQDTFFITIPANADPIKELVGATPKFYLSLGATVTPAMTEPQNFADLLTPPEYTVTAMSGGATHKYVVSYRFTRPQPIEYKENPASIDRLTLQPVGGSFGFNGDIIGSPAFCGLNHLVMFSRKYATLRVYDLPNLEVSATELNLGDINKADVAAITSDSQGNLVAAVGLNARGSSDIYYWTDPAAAPVKVGTTSQSVEYAGDEAAMMGTYLSCTGDITGTTGNAVIAFAGPRDDDGTHYKYYVYGGQLSADYVTIKTGYPSNDMNEFQMISFFSVKKNSAYLIGDCQKSDKTDGMQDEVQIRLNDANGNTIGQADYYNPDYNNWGGRWWQRTGQAMKNKGARRPTVHAMTLNGIEFALFSTGGGEACPDQQRTLITDKNLGVYYSDYQLFEGTKWLPDATAAAWRDYYTGSGVMCDWCFDDETRQGYIAVWYERCALVLYEVSCIAMI